MEPEYFDHVVKTYFTIVCGKTHLPTAQRRSAEAATCEVL
jgi:hypothetical protein